MKINLKANGKPQELILAYLKGNASDVLAEKINNGVLIEKEGKQLISKKTLDGFMKYATEEARKLAEKGAQSACVEDSVVYGWAIHYFEENTIEGTLYDEDGTEYKPASKTTSKVAAKLTQKEPPKPKQQQASLFDMFTAPAQETITEQPDNHELIEVDKETGEVIKTVQTNEHEQAEQVNPHYARYLKAKQKCSNHLLFQRLGDFYEVFAEDAKTSSEALDLTLTGRDVGLKERVAMAGIPYHAANVYFAKLLQKDFTIAVMEGDEIKIYPEEDTVTTDEDEPLDEKHLRTSFDKGTMLYLYDLLDGKMDIA